MLQLKNIKKIYKTGALQVEALRDVSLDFQKGEFVAVLGPSGCGKTTLLNVIGGLDRYDAGDMLVLGRSTRDFTEKDMDTYRNHAVGFVFQAYNLIVHQSVLANVELALTLTGISRKERRQRALDALKSVGLADQVHKKPGQLSGGQMQRVAIARALVNDPDILLADEPTGALDSATSEQVLDLLKELAKDRLVIMVTHNQELANRYATRIIQLKDGLVQSDTRPEVTADARHREDLLQKKTAMGFGTALSLSLNNLLTKRGRTLITAFAGSIGIIGIALILSLSNGVNQYILNVQKSTMSSYPITIEEETVQVAGMMDAAMGRAFREEKSHPLDKVYLNTDSLEHRSQVQATFTRNNLTAFKAYLEREDNPITPHVNDIRYGYNASFDLYTFDSKGEMRSLSGSAGMGGFGRAFSSMMSFDISGLKEISPSDSSGLVGDAFKEKHSLLAGRWPESADELLLQLNQNNELSDAMLYQLGLLTDEDLLALETSGEARANARSWRYEELLGREVRLLASSDAYVPAGDGSYRNLREDPDALKAIVTQAPLLKISGIIRETGSNNQRQGGLMYTRALTDLVILRAAQSPVVMAQQADEEKSILTGLRFAPEGSQEKAEDLQAFYARLPSERKTEFARQAMRLFPEYFKPDTQGEEAASSALPLPEGMSMEQVLGMMRLFTGGTGKDAPQIPEGGMELLKQWSQMSGITLESIGAGEGSQVAQVFESMLASADPEVLSALYDQLAAPEIPGLASTYRELGRVNLEMPASITLYMDTFEQKETIARLIEEYNQTAKEEEQIAYTDFVALMISGVTNIVNVISYVLIAFVAVSLVVSSIMIGIITYISVLERTKEIGILRSVGASKKDVGRVFTAEAFIIGLAAGVLGIGISALLIIPINQIIFLLSKDATVKAILPPVGAVILIGISALLSLLAGFLPSRIAAKKDPVECLRAE